MKKNVIIFHLHHRVAQEGLRLRCVGSFCCGALLKKTYLKIRGQDWTGAKNFTRTDIRTPDRSNMLSGPPF
jgi:hypothetical protein